MRYCVYTYFDINAMQNHTEYYLKVQKQTNTSLKFLSKYFSECIYYSASKHSLKSSAEHDPICFSLKIHYNICRLCA